MKHVTGDFRIQMEPQVPTFKGLDEAKLARVSYRKAYSGPLEAIGLGEMLSVQCAEPGCAGYVAIEQIKGVLDGLNGSFVVQHLGTKTAVDNQMTIDIVPGSGAGDLRGVSGALTIRMEGKRHFYDLNYQITPLETP